MSAFGSEIKRKPVAEIRAIWNTEAIPPKRTQFIKYGIWVVSAGLREFPDGHQYAGNLLAPMFRPVSDTSRNLELCGAQRFLYDATRSPDKHIMPGSKTDGAFVLLPLYDYMMQRNSLSEKSWLPKKARIVVVEDVLTGQAAHTSTANCAFSGGLKTIVLAALSPNNLPLVAKWLKSSGLSSEHEIVFAADNDGPKSRYAGIRKAVEAAEICGGKVALPEEPGFNLCDVLVKDVLLPFSGRAEIRRLFDEALTPAQVKETRPEVFGLQKQGREQAMSRGRGSGIEAEVGF